ncbi:uncharacterized protein LOC129921140 [Episyrphus balteatus]|uniref:uncharacterized protein LOC129921140 n=1 Tax=Episyrphus balteatus TaxID=286459 RepID=UPI00248649E4|nr:uncharacterized protein LOC129921140 [Episyrphus balteatus]
MVHCSYAGCEGKKQPRGGDSFFLFPPPDERRSLWIRHGSCTNLPNWPIKSYMCHKHFYAKDIRHRSGRKCLVDDALPISLVCNCTELVNDKSCSRLMDEWRLKKLASKTTAKAPRPPRTRKQPAPTTPELPPSDQSPSTPAIPSSPSSSDNLASTSAQTYVRPRVSLPYVSPSVPITQEQFPSPPPRPKVEPKKIIKRPPPRKIFRTPIKIKRSREYKLGEDLEQHMKNFSPQLKTFIKAQLFHKSHAPWAPKQKDLFLNLFYKSPACYTFMLSAGFKLPSVSSVYRWHSEIRLKTGLNESITDMLSKKSKEMTDMDKKCVLLFDEMAIKPELEYNIKDDIIYGFNDFGEYGGREDKIASKAMVFTLRGLNKNWKQTIAYFIGSPKGDMLCEMIKGIITGIMKCDLNIVATSCDQGGNNLKAYRLLNGTNTLEEKPWVEIGNKKIFLLYDYPHMFKSVRNNLLKHQICYGEDIVDWKIITKLYREDVKGTFRVFHKLTDAHINPASFQKLSVRLATQVFSANVASGINYAITSGCFQSEAEKKVARDTANFLQRMNNLFDNLNSGHLYSRNPNNKALSDSNEILSNIINARKWISTWTLVGTKFIPPCFRGLKQTLLGIEMMWNHHKSEEQSYFLLSHLNTDAAENVFSMLRNNRGSYEQNPSAWRLIRNLKQIIFQHLCSAEHSGYKDAAAEPLLKAAEFEEQNDIELEKLNEEYSLKEQVAEKLFRKKLKYVVDNVDVGHTDGGHINIEKLKKVIRRDHNYCKKMPLTAAEEEEDAALAAAEEEENPASPAEGGEEENPASPAEGGEEENPASPAEGGEEKKPASPAEGGEKENADSTVAEKLQNAAAAYYAGFAAYKLKDKLKSCEVCTRFMIEVSDVERINTVLIGFRAFETITSTSKSGKLTVPSIVFEETVRRVQSRYSWEELADIHFCYGLANGRDREAERLYAERFPNRRCPSRGTFSRTHRILREYGVLERRRSERPLTEESVAAPIHT